MNDFGCLACDKIFLPCFHCDNSFLHPSDDFCHRVNIALEGAFNFAYYKVSILALSNRTVKMQGIVVLSSCY